MKIISVIIPMYNSEKFIDKCLKSLLISNENLDKLDIVVVNDGSTDRSKEITEQYVKLYPSVIQLVNKMNGGHGSAINEAIHFCKGKYIKVLDADDWVDTNAMERIIVILDQIDADVIITNYRTYNIQNSKYALYGHKQKDVVLYDMKQILQQWEKVKSSFCIHGLIYSTKYYKIVNKKLPEKVYYDDAYYYTVIASYAKSILLINESVTVYRIGDVSQSISSKNRVQRINQHEEVIKKILDEKENIEVFSQEARGYWLRKIETTICDYYMTALLRSENRKKGRKIAKNMKNVICQRDLELDKRLRKRYRILYTMQLIGLKMNTMDKMLNSSLYRKMRNIIKSGG